MSNCISLGAKCQNQPASDAFFQAWKRAVEIAGPEWFGDGSFDGFTRAKSVNDLSPCLLKLTDALILGYSGGKRIFIASMVGFFDARMGETLLARVGFGGFSDLGKLDHEQRQAFSDLLLSYNGW